MADIKNKSYPNVGQSFGIVGMMILGMIVMSPILIIARRIIGNEAALFIYYLLAVGVPFGVVYLIRQQKTGNTTFNFRIENKKIIPLVMIASVALLFGIVSPISSLIPMPDSIKKVVGDMAGQNGIFTFLYMVIAAPILEESIFRGIMLDGLLKKYTPIKSILISSLLFGLVHLNPWQFITGLFFGIFIGWIYYKSGSLSLAILIHFTANLSGFLMRYFINDSSTDASLVESYGGILNMILLITGSLFVITASVFYIHNVFKQRSRIPVVDKDRSLT